MSKHLENFNQLLFICSQISRKSQQVFADLLAFFLQFAQNRIMKPNTKIRPYSQSDQPTLVDLLRLNTPKYFALEEEAEFISYLAHEIEQYFVVELNDEIVGCGGINLVENGAVGRISWDMLYPNSQGKGIGSKLLQHRIGVLKSNHTVKQIVVRTSQHVYPFYEKNGFELKEIKKDYWADGFDLYLMEYQP
ncbi:MAG: ribosomal-protein-alanine N-acetyltransferase [Bacteroidia bacterium]|jgi:ribosomal-protein-alanine N-acetyltransferase